MAGGSSNSNAPKPRKRVEAESSASSSLVRARDGSAFAKCEECNKSVPVVLISMHSCSLDAKIKMNLEAQVVEKPTEVKKKSVERKKPTSTEPKPKRLRKAAKDNSNKPKRPPTAFFLFMDDFRKEYKEANPESKGVKEVAKEGGERWNNMSEEEKKPYLDKAAELKAEYGKALESNNDAENGDEEGGSGKEDAVEKEDEGSEKEDANEKEDDAEKEDGNKKEDVAEKVEQEEEEVLDDY
ncbi:hypothetical protein Patl1_14959 [Pistacia atlantica]|uniref:Uncharacterized protein n=1 Tax=Pistacia atlantica TaxID=434234 RepID=A0ACC1B973_9ROSI|nr:hypothetical protein Patl1_14959 [Pistacia atlantica]